jgi:hypothetical protein
MQIALDVLGPNPPLSDVMRCAYDQAARVLQPANDWERDRLVSKIAELVQSGELDAQRLCRAVLSAMQVTRAADESED